MQLESLHRQEFGGQDGNADGVAVVAAGEVVTSGRVAEQLEVVPVVGVAIGGDVVEHGPNIKSSRAMSPVKPLP
jgi:hypothetical protein